jgi:GTP-binding protein HflX
MEVWNKIDLVEGDEREAVLNEAARREDVVPISAVSGEGVDTLSERIAQHLRGQSAVHHLKLSASDGSRLAWLHSKGEVLDSRNDGEQMHLAVRLSPANWERYQAL